MPSIRFWGNSLYNLPMHRNYTKSLLRSGIIEAKAGENNTTRRYLERAINASSDHELLAEAWYWMSQVTDGVVQGAVPAMPKSGLFNWLADLLED